MKSLLIIFIVLSTNSFSQPIALSFDEAKSKGITVELLDKKYSNALNADSTKCIFFKHESQFQNAYKRLLEDLNRFLSQQNFKWQKNVRCFNRIYFSANGKIDYFLFKFLEDQVDINTKKKFQELLQNFIQNYTFPLHARVNFAQCSPVIYQSVN